jgi:hypothetical protein
MNKAKHCSGRIYIIGGMVSNKHVYKIILDIRSTLKKINQIKETVSDRKY